MERETGIEPAQSAWKAEVLPLNYSRTARNSSGGGRWIRTTEGVSQQIYSLPPLAAWVSLRNAFSRSARRFRVASTALFRPRKRSRVLSGPAQPTVKAEKSEETEGCERRRADL